MFIVDVVATTQRWTVALSRRPRNQEHPDGATSRKETEVKEEEKKEGK